MMQLTSGADIIYSKSYRLVVNRKPARRIRRELGLLRPRRRSQWRTTNSQRCFGRFPYRVADRTAHAPDEIWVCDITYVCPDTGFIRRVARCPGPAYAGHSP